LVHEKEWGETGSRKWSQAGETKKRKELILVNREVLNGNDRSLPAKISSHKHKRRRASRPAFRDLISGGGEKLRASGVCSQDHKRKYKGEDKLLHLPGSQERRRRGREAKGELYLYHDSQVKARGKHFLGGETGLFTY